MENRNFCFNSSVCYNNKIAHTWAGVIVRIDACYKSRRGHCVIWMRFEKCLEVGIMSHFVSLSTGEHYVP